MIGKQLFLNKYREGIVDKVIDIPDNVNMFDLSKLIKIEISELLDKAYTLAEELGIVVIDEFQPVRKELIELI